MTAGTFSIEWVHSLGIGQISATALGGLFLSALVVGVLIGAVGIGGVILIPALAWFAGLQTQEAMATALFSFFFTGLVGTHRFYARGSIDWDLTLPLCAGAAALGFLGAYVSSYLTAPLLNLILAMVILFAGLHGLRPLPMGRKPIFNGERVHQRVSLFAIGAVSGFGAGLTGVGGPALSVPLLVLFGFPVLPSIASSQVVQILAAASGTVANSKFGSINLQLALAVAAFEVVGVVLGVRVAHYVSQENLRRFVAHICVVLGLALAMVALFRSDTA